MAKRPHECPDCTCDGCVAHDRIWSNVPTANASSLGDGFARMWEYLTRVRDDLEPCLAPLPGDLDPIAPEPERVLAESVQRRLTTPRERVSLNYPLITPEGYVYHDESDAPQLTELHIDHEPDVYARAKAPRNNTP